MKLLVSPTSVAEARVAIGAPVDVIDIKNPAEGSLGCPHPNVAREIAKLARSADREVSIALGDLHHQPGTAAMAALGAIQLGVDYVKAGMRGSRTRCQATDVLEWIVSTLRWAEANEVANSATNPQMVACGYADFQQFDGLAPHDLVAAAAASSCDFVMLDTLVKDGRSLFDHLNFSQLQEFVIAARENGLRAALAGSLGPQHLPLLIELQPDFIGVRGAICENSNRGSRICPDRTQAFVDAAAGT